MSVVLSLPSEYGWVLTAAASTLFVNFYHVILTSGERKKAGVKYPTTYVSQELADKDPKAYRFNCAQRAHANFTENHTSALAATLITGLKFPIFGAAAGFTWALGRVVYARGYVAKGPTGRSLGARIGGISLYPLYLTALYTGVTLALDL